MAAIKANGILKFLVFALVGGAIFIGVLAFKGKGSSPETINTQPDTVVYDLTESEQRELGITAGDTPHDTLKTLLGAVKQTRADVKAVREENEKLKSENTVLKQNANNISQQIADALEQKQSEFDQAFSALRAEMGATQNGQTPPNQQAASQTGQSNTTQYPIGGLGLDTEPSAQAPQGKNNVLAPVASKAGKQVRWVEPADAVYKDKSGKVVDSLSPESAPAFPNPFKTLDESPLGEATDKVTNDASNTSSAVKSNTVPYFTLPVNSTLLGSVSMTALIGRVPLNGSVTDPYPFKVVIGRDNLTANGIELPDVEGAIVSGTASGDWTLSCVNGKVESITFVFGDGRVVTNQDQKSSNGGDKGIGWLSNPAGLPCIPGDRKTNAPEYLTSQFLLAGAGAAAQGLSQGQTTTVVENGSVIGAVTGNQGKFIWGQALGGGLQETTEWLRQRYGQTFDAVYVPPGQAVAVHITQELKIDYNPSGRKVKYQNHHSPRRLD